MPYEIIEHTADVGLKLWAKDLPGLFRDVAAGFFNFLTDLSALEKSTPVFYHEVEVNFQEDNAEDLFMHWLQELLFVFSVRHFVLTEYYFVSLTPMMLKLKAKAIQFDPKRHVLRYEIKAVTYHQFHVAKTQGGWEAEVIFDI